MRLILYIAPYDGPSQEALKHFPPSCGLVNITLMKERPSWLSGVPVLVDRTSNLVYHGSHAILFLQNIAPYKVKMPPLAPELPADTGSTEVPLTDDTVTLSTEDLTSGGNSTQPPLASGVAT